MTDPHPTDLPPAPPEPALVASPEAVPAWQARLEVVALLLLATTAVSVVARLATAYDQARLAQSFGQSLDLVAVVRLAGEQTAYFAAGSVLVAYLLVTLGPGGGLSRRGLLALRATTVVGLAVAGLAAFAGLASLATASDAAAAGPFGSPGSRSPVDRLSDGVPLLLAAAIAGYVAWCAFSALGEDPAPLFPDVEVDAVDEDPAVRRRR